MSAIPVLKKKLKSIKATAKLSSAMKTVSAAKYAKLSVWWRTYSEYTNQYKLLISQKETENKGETVVILGSNRGFCGGFNNEIIRFYKENFNEKPKNLIACGNELISDLKETGIIPDYTFSFDDLPDISQCFPLLDLLQNLAGDTKDYTVTVVHNHYQNTLIQTPQSSALPVHPTELLQLSDDVYWVPDKETVLDNLLEKSFRSFIFGAVLETALGAQASTLMTMRSANDTANEYSASLESKIQRLRQSEITADVIETRGGNQ